MDFERKDISKEEIKQLPVIQFGGQINVIDQPWEVRDAIEFLSEQDYIGFDTETRPSFQKGVSYKVSLVQLATEEEVFLFRLNYLGFPEELKQLFEDEEVIKVGFDLKSDFSQLRKVVKFEPKGFVDLQQIAREHGFKNVSLRKLTALLLGRRLSKRQRLSNWDNEELTEGQIVYAATDAWVTLILFKIFNQK